MIPVHRCYGRVGTPVEDIVFNQGIRAPIDCNAADEITLVVVQAELGAQGLDL